VICVFPVPGGPWSRRPRFNFTYCTNPSVQSKN
jgi:hypothetical protein